FLARRHDRYIDVIVPQEFPNTELLGRIVLYNQQALASRRRVLFDSRKSSFKLFGSCRFGDEGKCSACQTMVAIFVEGQHLDGDVPRGWILFQMVEHRPAQHVGQKNVEGDGGWMILARQRKSFRAT